MTVPVQMCIAHVLLVTVVVIKLRTQEGGKESLKHFEIMKFEVGIMLYKNQRDIQAFPE